MSSAAPFSAAESLAWSRLVAVSALLPTTLDAQLLRDAELTHFEYVVLMVLAESPNQTSRMTRLGSLTNATLPRLSHVARRLEDRGLIRRFPCPEDKRATNATITAPGIALLDKSMPGHLRSVRSSVLDALTEEQLDQLAVIAGQILARLDPEERMAATCLSSISAGSVAEQIPAGA